ncbi:lambda family phage portal protein [Methylorubrum extorquens]
MARRSHPPGPKAPVGAFGPAPAAPRAAAAAAAPAQAKEASARKGMWRRFIGGVAATASMFVGKNQPLVSPFEAASQSDTLPYVQNIGPNDVARYQRQIVGQGRQLYRNQGDIRGALRALADDVVGGGPKVNPRLPGMKAVLKAWFQECDASGLRNFGGLLRQCYLAERVDGEVFIRMRPRLQSDGLTLPLQLEALECDHVPWEWTRWAPNGNRIIAGIELDKLRRRVAYWMTPFHPADSLTRNLEPQTNLPQPVPADQVIYIGNPERLAGQRSESSLVAAIVKAINLGIYEGAEQTRKNISTLFAGFFRRLPEDGATPLPAEEDSHDITSAMLRQVPLEPGILAELPYGTTIEWSDPPDTGDNYEAFTRSQRMYIAMCVESSYEDFTGDFRGVNDRSWKAGQVKRRVMIDRERDRLTFQVWDKLYPVLVDLAIATGKVKRPAGWTDEQVYESTLTWPGSRNPNQFQEWNAWVLAVTNGLVSRDEAIEANGGDPFEVDRRNAVGKLRADALDLHYPVYTLKAPTGMRQDLASGTPDTGGTPPGGGAPGGGDDDAPDAPAPKPTQPPDPSGGLLDALKREILEELRDLIAQAR